MKKSAQPVNTTFIKKAVQLATAYDEQTDTPWLSDYRQSQTTLLAESKFPHSQVEHFKYNRLHAFAKQDFDTFFSQKNLANIDADIKAIINEHTIRDMDTTARIVFVNGILDTECSQLTNYTKAFSETNEAEQKRIISALSAQSVTHNPFILHNACLSSQGVYIDINADISTNHNDAIIDIIYIDTDESAEHSTANQIIINIADRCKATVVSRTLSAGKAGSLSLNTSRMIANIGNSSTLTHYHLPLEHSQSDAGLYFSSICYNLQSHATLNAFHAITGGTLKKVDLAANHLGEHAQANINGLYIASENEQVDYHTSVTHRLPHGTTNENFRGIVNGQAEAVFNGRIHIFENAQKTLAELSNKNLVLSDDAVLHTKPELEIYADDVICAHGATVSRLQDDAINYLRARGINKAQAEKMLSYAFFDELLAELEHQSIADHIRPMLFARFR